MYSDLFSQVYDKFGWNYYPEIFGEQLLQWISRQGISVKKALDIGCGTGILCSILQENGIEAAGMDLSHGMIAMAKEKYPEIYHQVEVRLETGWETTIALLEQGMQEGVIRPVQIPILKMMLEASLEQFFQRDILLQNEITYAQALQEVVGILMYGIASER